MDKRKWEEETCTPLPPEERTTRVKLHLPLVEAIRFVLWDKADELPKKFVRLKDRHPLTGHSLVASELYYRATMFYRDLELAYTKVGPYLHWFLVHKHQGFPIIDVIPDEFPGKRVPYQAAERKVIDDYTHPLWLFEEVRKVKKELEHEQELFESSHPTGKGISLLQDSQFRTFQYQPIWTGASSTTGSGQYYITMGQGISASIVGNP